MIAKATERTIARTIGAMATTVRASTTGRRSAATQRRHFEPQHQVLVRDYYADHYRGRRCPPGLAKKHNGCLPPGQAKKWRVGRPLPRDVIYYEVPQPLVVQIGLPPVGHRYVRVAGDILLIAIGTGWWSTRFRISAGIEAAPPARMTDHER
jgi:Ni/Co efflux regulator RcnB